MESGNEHNDAFEKVLKTTLRQPLFLTTGEVAGGWRELFPDLESSLPRPHPIFTYDEDEVILHGFVVLLSPGMKLVRKEVEKQVLLETEFKCLTTTNGAGDKRKVMMQRERYLRGMSSLLENALLNDYQRSLVEILILFHSTDVARSVARVPSMMMKHSSPVELSYADKFRYDIAAVFGDLLLRATQNAVERLRSMPQSISPELTPLVNTICQDLLLLAETRPPVDLKQMREYLRLRFRRGAAEVSAAHEGAVLRLRALLRDRPQLRAALQLASNIELDLQESNMLLQPRLLDAIRAIGLAPPLGLTEELLELLKDLGLRLKRFELLAAFRTSIHAVEQQAGGLVLCERKPEISIAQATRPFDFTRPGVLDTAVRRFGLVYDLSNFTALLEGVRKKGPKAEEQALQFMYLFQSRLEEIRQRRRLKFEKFLGDGAFYSSRRAYPVIAAACEINALYNELRGQGFPFDQGMRIAVNYGTYRLLPMLTQGRDQLRFEFFGHGIVELARLTTGKSTREVEDIAEFLVHSGYNPSLVDKFMQPLMSARGGQEETANRAYAATIDNRGELVNEGIVLTIPFLDELEKQLGDTPMSKASVWGFDWLCFPLDPEQTSTLYAGLRYLGVARLKGLPPVELVEACVLRELAPDAESLQIDKPVQLINIVRRFAQKDDGPEASGESGAAIPEDLVIATFLEENGNRRWIFGEYREGDDVLLSAIRVQMHTPPLNDNEPLEMWIFRKRFELARIYERYRLEATGHSLPLHSLRRRNGYLACFLAAPHKSP